MSCRFVLSIVTYLLLALNRAQLLTTTTTYTPWSTSYSTAATTWSPSYSWQTTDSTNSSKATCYPRNYSDVSLISNVSFWPSFMLTIPFSFILFKLFLKYFHKEWQTVHDVDISTLYHQVNGKVNKIKLLLKSITYSGIISTISTTIYILLSYDKCPSQTDGVSIGYVISPKHMSRTISPKHMRFSARTLKLSYYG
eukprot:180288_1